MFGCLSQQLQQAPYLTITDAVVHLVKLPVESMGKKLQALRKKAKKQVFPITF